MKFIKFNNQYINTAFIKRYWLGLKATHGHSFVAIYLGDKFLEEFKTDDEAQARFIHLQADLSEPQFVQLPVQELWPKADPLRPLIMTYNPTCTFEPNDCEDK